MLRKYIVILLAIFILIGLMVSSGRVAAQDQQPSSPDPTTNNPNFFDQQGDSTNLHDPQRNSERQAESPNEMYYQQNQSVGQMPEATGGPDDYGYTWNNSTVFSWIDARSLGTNTGLYGGDVYTGPYSMGFSLPFYENNYNQLYLNTKGLVSFSNGGVWWNNTRIPVPATPNNIILPFWDDLGMYKGNRPDAGIFILQGGIAPNRYFVIEWYRADAYSGSGPNGMGTRDLTFEVILYENGDVVMQYLNLDGDLSSATVGIEDNTGTDGLQYLYNSAGLVDGLAVRFFRPGPSARVKVWSLNQGRFTHASELETFQLPIRNSGELGADIYDLEISSTWPISLYKADGITLLTDTDADGLVDTGPVAQGSTFTVIVKIQTINPANVGDSNLAMITVRSSLNPGKSKSVRLSTTIPAPFAQVYTDDNDGAMSLYLVKPTSQSLRKASADYHYGSDVAVSEANNGNLFYFWGIYRCTTNLCGVYVEEIEYTILNHAGDVIRPVGKLVDNSQATMTTEDFSPAITVAPDGRTGVIWTRYLYNNQTNKSNYNIFFTILDASGNIIKGPTNLTNNNSWGSYNDYGIPQFYSTRIAATGDNRFVLAWERYSLESAGSLDDIYYAIRDTNNNSVRGITKFTNDTPGNDQDYYDPTLSSVNSNRIILGWSQYVNNSSNTAYAGLDSGGNIIKPATILSLSGWDMDAAQLSDGHILLAWTSWGTDYQIAYAILDNNYNLTTSPTFLSNPAAAMGDDYVSVTTDQAGHAILTWMDYSYDYRPNLYYALINGNGGLLTQPMIFRSNLYGALQSSFQGYGNTTYSITPTTAQVDTFIASNNTIGAPPGGTGIIPISFGNNGLSTATSVVITATLDNNLIYVSDTSGVIPTIIGNTITWSLPAGMPFLGYGQFSLQVNVPNAPFGTMYPVALQIGSAGPEGNPGDNTYNLNVMVARQVFLPILSRSYP